MKSNISNFRALTKLLFVVFILNRFLEPLVIYAAERAKLGPAAEDRAREEAELKVWIERNSPIWAGKVGLAAASKERPWINSLGMKYVPVPGTKVLFCIWETRVKDFEAFVNATGYDATSGVFSARKEGWKRYGDTWKNPGFVQGPTHPVCGVSWDDAHAFCEWITEKEQKAGIITSNEGYRLPTDLEWSVAVGLSEPNSGTPQDKHYKIKDIYPWGTQWHPPPEVGNYPGEEANDTDWPSNWITIENYRDNYPKTAPVGSFDANEFGLYDLGGNVWEWSESFYDGRGGNRVLRGAAWNSFNRFYLMSSYRCNESPDIRRSFNGFRCVLFRQDQVHLIQPSDLQEASTNPTPELRYCAARHAATPGNSLEQLARDPVHDVRYGVASNPRTPAIVLASLCNDTDPAVRAAAICNISTPDEAVAKSIDDANEIPQNALIRRVAEHGHPGVEVLAASKTLRVRTCAVGLFDRIKNIKAWETLSFNPFKDVRVAVASCTQIPSSLLVLHGNDVDNDVRQKALKNPMLDAKATEQLADSFYDDVIWSIANHPRVTEAALLKIAAKADTALKRIIASRSTAPKALLTQWASDSDIELRATVAANPYTPAAVLIRLAGDIQTSVRMELAANPACPESILKQFLKDRQPSVRDAISKNLGASFSILLALGEDPDEHIQGALCERVKVGVWTESQIAEIAKSPSSTVRWALLIRPDISPEMINRMVCDPSESIRLKLIEDSRVGTTALIRLAEDIDESVRRLTALSARMSPSMFACLSNREMADVRITLAKDTGSSPELLNKLAQDGVMEVRRAVAANTNTPLILLRQLAQQSCPEVADAAKNNPVYLREVSRNTESKSTYGKK